MFFPSRRERVRLKKWMWTIPLALCVIGGSGWYAEHRMKQAVGKQMVNLLSQPDSQQEINQLLAQYGVGGTGGSASSIGTQNSTTSTVPNSVKDVHDSSHAAGNASSHSASVGTTLQKASGSGSASSETTTKHASSPKRAHTSAGHTDAHSSSTASKVSTTKPTHTTSTKLPVFTSRQQIVQFAMSRFTQGEIAHYIKLYAERSTLTRQQKDQIKAEVLSHFTPAEIQDMEVAAQKYK